MKRKFKPNRLFIGASASLLLSLSYHLQTTQAQEKDSENTFEQFSNDSTNINAPQPSINTDNQNETTALSNNFTESLSPTSNTNPASDNDITTTANTIDTLALADTDTKIEPSNENKIYTTEEYLALPAPTMTTVTVQGIITQNTIQANSGGTSLSIGPTVDAEKSAIVPVQLPKGTLRDQFSIEQNPTLIGKTVKVTGTSETYFKVNGIKTPNLSIELIDSLADIPNTSDPIPPQPEISQIIPENVTPIAKMRNGQKDTQYTIRGTVVSPINGWGGNGFYVQDESGAGIYVYPGNNISTSAKQNEGIVLTGTLSDYRGALQLGKIKDVSIIEKTNDITISETTINNLSSELQSTLIKLSRVTVGDITSDNFGTANFSVTDEHNNTIAVRLDNRTGVKFADLQTKINTGDIINLTAILNTFNNSNQLLPFSLDHFEIVEKNTPASKVEIKKIGEIQGAGHASPFINHRVEIKEAIVTFTEGKNRFYIQDRTPDTDQKTSDGIEVYLQNHNLSIGDLINLTGIVKERLGNGYTDKVDTDLTITQIEADKESIVKIGTVELPKPLIIDKDVQIPKRIIGNEGFALYDPSNNALDFWESIEGMLVAVENPKILGPQKYGDLYVLPGNSTRQLNNSGGINLEKDHFNTDKINILLKNGAGDNRNFIAKAGDAFDGTLTGPVSYGFTSYKVLVDSNNLPTFIKGNLQPEVTHLEVNKEHLSIASYNIENFTANTKETSDDKVARIAKSIITNLKSPDIISIVEMQDDDGTTNSGNTSAHTSAKRLIDAITANGGPSYTYIDIAPLNNQDGGAIGGNIRNGFLYNAERVRLVDKPVGDASTSVSWNGNGLSHSIGRIDANGSIWQNTRKPLIAEFEFTATPNDVQNPERVIVISTHLNSKRGDNGVFGKIQPVTFGSEAKRHELATVINQFIENGKALNPNLNVVLAGDFNDYEFTRTIEILEGNSMINLVSLHDEKDRYSYFYQGNNQSLDNVLISKTLFEWSKFDMVHINAPFMEEHGRASDHDPLLLHLNLAKRLVKLEEERINIPFNVIRKLNDQLEEGVERIIQEGIEGKTLNTYSVLTINHIVQSKELMTSQIVTDAQDQIIEVGIKKKFELEPISPLPIPTEDNKKTSNSEEAVENTNDSAHNETESNNNSNTSDESMVETNNSTHNQLDGNHSAVVNSDDKNSVENSNTSHSESDSNNTTDKVITDNENTVEYNTPSNSTSDKTNSSTIIDINVKEASVFLNELSVSKDQLNHFVSLLEKIIKLLLSDQREKLLLLVNEQSFFELLLKALNYFINNEFNTNLLGLNFELETYLNIFELNDIKTDNNQKFKAFHHLNDEKIKKSLIEIKTLLNTSSQLVDTPAIIALIEEMSLLTKD